MPGLGLKTRITLAVSVLVVGILFLTSIFSLRYFEQYFKETISNQQFELVTAIADDIDYRIADALRLIQSASSNGTSSPDKLREVLASGQPINGVAFLTTGEPKLP